MLGRVSLTLVAEAKAILLDALANSSVETESCSLSDALDRVLGKDILSPENLPTHPRSTMDGFAVRAADTFGASSSMPCYLEIDGDVAMGQMPTGEVLQGKCFRIATGGLLPKGSDAVMMFEHTIPVDDRMIEVVKSVGVGINLINRGEDIEKGKTGTPKGPSAPPSGSWIVGRTGDCKG